MQHRTRRINFSPLFKMEGDKVLRRKDVNDLNDKHWTADWWGWSTYLLLKDYNTQYAGLSRTVCRDCDF